jgi:hypothetical protein
MAPIQGEHCDLMTMEDSLENDYLQSSHLVNALCVGAFPNIIPQILPFFCSDLALQQKPISTQKHFALQTQPNKHQRKAYPNEAR